MGTRTGDGVLTGSNRLPGPLAAGAVCAAKKEGYGKCVGFVRRCAVASKLGTGRRGKEGVTLPYLTLLYALTKPLGKPFSDSAATTYDCDFKADSRQLNTVLHYHAYAYPNR